MDESGGYEPCPPILDVAEGLLAQQSKHRIYAMYVHIMHTYVDISYVDTS
jgi:hypothetical protein